MTVYKEISVIQGLSVKIVLHGDRLDVEVFRDFTKYCWNLWLLSSSEEAHELAFSHFSYKSYHSGAPFVERLSFDSILVQALSAKVTELLPTFSALSGNPGNLG